jgi:nucleotide-binding universal stress UspA family protein
MQSITTGFEPTLMEAKTIFDRLFVPVDYSMDSHRAVGAALELQRVLGSSVCLFHAAESDGTHEFLGGLGSSAVNGDWLVHAEQRLRRFVENVAPECGERIELRARMGGETVRLVHDEAHRWGATLIIVSAEVRARIFRSKAERLIHDFDLPTLVIPTESTRH